MRSSLFALAFLIATTFTSLHAKAGMVMFTDSVSVTTSNWSDTIDVPLFREGLFDGSTTVPTGSTLTSVTVSLDGKLIGTLGYENLGPNIDAIFLTQSAVITLKSPSNTTLLTVNLLNQETANNVPSFDGSLDFAGTSGNTYPNLMDSDSTTTVPPLTNATILAAFTGLGNLSLDIDATATSTAIGGGNVTSFFQTLAGADVKVIYEYESPNPGPDVPEPASAVITLLGCLALLRRPMRHAH